MLEWRVESPDDLENFIRFTEHLDQQAEETLCLDDMGNDMESRDAFLQEGRQTLEGQGDLRVTAEVDLKTDGAVTMLDVPPDRPALNWGSGGTSSGRGNPASWKTSWNRTASTGKARVLCIRTGRIPAERGKALERCGPRRTERPGTLLRIGRTAAE